MVKADCEICAPYNHGPSVHADICPLMTEMGMTWKDHATETILSSSQDIDLKIEAIQDGRRIYQILNVDQRYLDLQRDKRDECNTSPAYLHDFQNFVARKDPMGPKDLTVNVFIEGSSGCLRLTHSGMLQEAQNHGRPLPSPESPSMETSESRKSTFERNTPLFQPSRVVQCVENGFYKADDCNVKCFHCGISFRKDNFDDLAWDIRIEHSRWSPFCGYLQHIHGKESGLDSDVHTSDVNCEQG